MGWKNARWCPPLKRRMSSGSRKRIAPSQAAGHQSVWTRTMRKRSQAESGTRTSGISSAARTGSIALLRSQ